jgi:hypothetical protein
MPVQYNVLVRKAIQYIVLYCLTPVPVGDYIGLNLCPFPPAWDNGNGTKDVRNASQMNLNKQELVGGIHPVNSPECRRSGNWLEQPITAFEGVHVA